LKIVYPNTIESKEIVVGHERLDINGILQIIEEKVGYLCNQEIFINNIDADLVKVLSIRENKVEITIFKPNYC